jgi:hypothetical protein
MENVVIQSNRFNHFFKKWQFFSLLCKEWFSGDGAFKRSAFALLICERPLIRRKEPILKFVPCRPLLCPCEFFTREPSDRYFQRKNYPLPLSFVIGILANQSEDKIFFTK